MTTSEFLYMIRHDEFLDFSKQVWAFSPLKPEYDTRLEPLLASAQGYAIGTTASGDTTSEDELEPARKILKRKRAGTIKQLNSVTEREDINA